MFYDPTFLLLIPVLILAFYAQRKVKGNYIKYSKVKNASGTTGAEVARNILQSNGINDVKIQEIDGTLTDNYNSKKKELNLSHDVYHGDSISAISIAAHEAGHAIQHAENYAPLDIRTGIFPIANFGSMLAFPMFIIGLLMRTPLLMDIGIILFAGALVFHVVTLPVEFNASKRALAHLKKNYVANADEMTGAQKVLNAAALTYVASTLMALMQFLRLLVLRGSRD